MAIYASEITSEQHISDNPIHQRLLKAYYEAIPFIKGDLLEIGCGEGRGIDLLAPLATFYSAIDKIAEIEAKIKSKFPAAKFYNMNVPPFSGIADASFDTIVSFQVIEHIEDDKGFLQEIHRVLKPGGKAILSTPNITMSLTRNPWHVREYTAAQFEALCSKYFSKVEAKGITGSERVWNYYEENKVSVSKYKRLDIFNLEQRLPASILRIPYDILNRMNRNKLHTTHTGLVAEINQEDFHLSDHAADCFDLFYILSK
jgi:2-polyprenyl-3-methyl-5-hydroxy-6-metoxy-1,4-benzoquinol methylase